MCYPVESEADLHAVVEALLEDRASFVVVTDGDNWVETSLLRPGEELTLKRGQVATVVSWSGVHDKVVTAKDAR
jgi:predicted type IV restriction endonuclease